MALNVLLHSSPTPPKLSTLVKDRGDGSYVFISQSGYRYSCRVVVVNKGSRVQEIELPDNTFGGYFKTLHKYLMAGLNIRAVLHRADSVAGINKALGKFKPAERPPLAVQRIE
ncbi:hypothetical protein CL655_00435 [bacterium]|nr:hypothetical protein [bacterium]|tara:strand:- start:3044 stop:3382 length:339 start_codon:yes stop_codon:yes gene_type:complete